MTGEILSTLLQASGAAGVSAIFIWYLSKRDKKEQDERTQVYQMVANFNITMSSHVQTASKVMQEVSDTNRELKSVIEKLYAQNWKLSKKSIN